MHHTILALDSMVAPDSTLHLMCDKKVVCDDGDEHAGMVNILAEFIHGSDVVTWRYLRRYGLRANDGSSQGCTIGNEAHLKYCARLLQVTARFALLLADCTGRCCYMQLIALLLWYFTQPLDDDESTL